MRTQGGKKDDISYSWSIPRSSPASRETVPPACPRSPPRLLRLSNLCNSAGTDFYILHFPASCSSHPH